MSLYSMPTRRTHLNTADWISIYRIIAIPFLVIALLVQLDTLFGIILGLSLISDIVDGYVARKMKTTTLRGARLDSIGDAFTFTMAFIGIIVLRNDFVQENWILITSTIVLYLAQILVSLILFEHPTSYHTYLAKAAAICQGCFILTLLLVGSYDWMLYITVAITIAEIIEEFILVFMIGGEPINVKGLYWVLRDRKNAPGDKGQGVK